MHQVYFWYLLYRCQVCIGYVPRVCSKQVLCVSGCIVYSYHRLIKAKSEQCWDKPGEASQSPCGPAAKGTAQTVWGPEGPDYTTGPGEAVTRHLQVQQLSLQSAPDSSPSPDRLSLQDAARQSRGESKNQVWITTFTWIIQTLLSQQVCNEEEEEEEVYHLRFWFDVFETGFNLLEGADFFKAQQ